MRQKRFLSLFLLSFFCLFQLAAQQQELQPLPIDPQVRYGKLPNGLTYYIRHNEQPKERADFYIAQNVGSMLEEENQRGLAHFLSGQATLEDVICSTNVKNFYMIYSGPFPPNPAELLGGKNFRSLLNALRKVYDYVIVDTPPLGSVIDSAIVAEICDGSIMVIESGVISYRFAQEVKSQLERSNCPLLGVVLNKVDMQKQAYGKYGKYGQYKYGDYGQEEDD